MSIFSSDFRPLRRSLSLPDLIASRHDSSVSGGTVSTGITMAGSCSILDKISFNEVYHNHHPCDHHHNHHHHHHQLIYQQHPHYSKDHKKPDNIYNTRLVADLRQLMTLHQHYYPEGGWGWIILLIGTLVQCICHGLHMAVGMMLVTVVTEFEQDTFYTGMLGSLSISVGLFFSPVITSICHKKSTRLLAVIGGLVTTLGCLFSSFALQFHQLFFSYALIVGIGVGITRDCSTIVTAQYFKRKKEFIEMIMGAGSGIGIIFMSNFFSKAIKAFGWRHGMQCITLTVFLTFFLGLFYRSASLYHPQRRAILHLKNQKRKVKEKNRHRNHIPFFDLKTLRSKTMQIILLSSGISSFGIYLPIVDLAQHLQNIELTDKILTIQINFGLAWIFGSLFFGLLVIRHNPECRIAKQYLCQASLFICALCILAFATLNQNYEGYLIVMIVYGFFCGGYNYAIRMYVFERVRARHFALAWSYLQFFQSIPIFIGNTFAERVNEPGDIRRGYLFASVMTVIGSCLFFINNFRKRNLSMSRSSGDRGSHHFCMQDFYTVNRRNSFVHDIDPELDNNVGVLLLQSEIGDVVCGEPDVTVNVNGSLLRSVNDSAIVIDKPELTCISEEKIADMDLLESTSKAEKEIA